MSKRAKQLVSAGRGNEPPEKPNRPRKLPGPRVSLARRKLWEKEANRYRFSEDQKERERYWNDDEFLGVDMFSRVSDLRALYGRQIRLVARYYGVDLSTLNASFWNRSISIGQVMDEWRTERLRRSRETLNHMTTIIPEDTMNIVFDYMVGSLRDDLVSLFRILRPVPSDWEPESTDPPDELL